ncbi:MAG: N-acetyl-gamma-glutamyl-phosphate reductase [Candidatus Ranarchaeia archaeon]
MIEFNDLPTIKAKSKPDPKEKIISQKGDKRKVAVIGGSGYIGAELVRLLLNHSGIQLETVTSRNFAGKKISEVLPNLKKRIDLTYVKPNLEKIAKNCELIFFATENGYAMKNIPKIVDLEVKMIDMAADFRLTNPTTYELYYKNKHTAVELLDTAVYGIPEFFRDKIEIAQIVANPGCYPTCALMGLLPLASHKLLGDSVSINGITGSSGSGAKPSETAHHPLRFQDFKGYNPLKHRHTPEIQQQISEKQKDVNVLFTPHSAPISRGMYTTIHTSSKDAPPLPDLVNLFRQYYDKESFIRVTDTPPRVVNVVYSNFCDLSVTSEKNNIVVFTAIDNLVKGGSGQAIQNMNIMLGFAEDEGLKMLPGHP